MKNGLTKEELSQHCSNEEASTIMAENWDKNASVRKAEFKTMLLDEKKKHLDDSVVFKNELNDFDIGKLSAKAQDIFYHILQNLFEKGNLVVEMSFESIKSVIGLTHQSDDRLCDELQNIKLYAARMCFTYKDRRWDIVGNIFPTFAINKDERNVKVRVSEDFIYLFNKLFEGSCYTVVNYKEFLSLKSKHAKTLYTLLSQWQYNGKTQKYTYDFLKARFGTPNYSDRNFRSKVLDPAIEECSKYFKKLDFNKETLVFSFKKRDRQLYEYKSISKSTGFGKLNPIFVID